MPNPAIYRFDRFTLDLGRGMLLADGEERALRPKSFALLCHLVENAERLVSRDEIMRAVWPDVLVTEDSITQCIREIRRALGDEAQTILRTVTKRGPCHSSMVVALVETGHLDEARAAMCEVLRLRRPGWTVHDYEGVFGFRSRADTDRFLDAFRAAMA